MMELKWKPIFDPCPILPIKEKETKGKIYYFYGCTYSFLINMVCHMNDVFFIT